MVQLRYSDCTELRLSSAFEHLSGKPKLELIVTVLNVNEGHNAGVDAALQYVKKNMHSMLPECATMRQTCL